MKPEKLVYLHMDDIDYHKSGCKCGRCNCNGKSIGVAIKRVLDPDGDPIERIYGPSEDAALHNARLECERGGFRVVDLDEGYITGAVDIDLKDMELGRFLDLMSRGLTGTGLLEDVSYELVGCAGNTLNLRVTGSIATIRKDYGGKR